MTGGPLDVKKKFCFPKILIRLSKKKKIFRPTLITIYNILQIQRRVKVAYKMLVKVAEDQTFIKCIIAGDKIRVYGYEIETVQESRE